MHALFLSWGFAALVDARTRVQTIIDVTQPGAKQLRLWSVKWMHYGSHLVDAGEGAGAAPSQGVKRNVAKVHSLIRPGRLAGHRFIPRELAPLSIPLEVWAEHTSRDPSLLILSPLRQRN